MDKKKKRTSLQDIYLNQLRKRQTTVHLYLTNGARITGKIEGFDQYTILFNSYKRQQLIYKDGIISIVPRSPRTEIFATKGRLQNKVSETPKVT